MMIDLYMAPTPNSLKILIFLEECEVEYNRIQVDILSGQQFNPEFVAINPNGKVPAIVDHAPRDGGASLNLFESGSILMYLAEKTGRFLPSSLRERSRVLNWLFWQMAGLGPMTGQFSHFAVYAPEPIPYAIERYRREVDRLYHVMESQLKLHEFIAGDYSIADMACFGYAIASHRAGQDLSQIPHVSRWLDAMLERPAVDRALKHIPSFEPFKLTPEQWAILYAGRRARALLDEAGDKDVATRGAG